MRGEHVNICECPANINSELITLLRDFSHGAVLVCLGNRLGGDEGSGDGPRKEFGIIKTLTKDLNFEFTNAIAFCVGLPARCHKRGDEVPFFTLFDSVGRILPMKLFMHGCICH